MSQEQQQDQTAPVLYDAAAAHTIPVTLTRTIKGQRKNYKVLHQLSACSNETYIDYDKARNVRIRVHKDKSVETLADEREAADFLYGQLLAEVRGWGDPQGANVDAEHADLVIRGGLLAAIVIKGDAPVVLGNADEDQPWQQTEEVEPLNLHCRFNGAELITQHTPRSFASAAGAEELSKLRTRYESLQGRKKYGAGVRVGQADVKLESNARPLGKLYDEIFVEARGYQGRVPLWHKCEVIAAFFEPEEAQAGEI